jgi:hypothetical protein
MFIGKSIRILIAISSMSGAIISVASATETKPIVVVGIALNSVATVHPAPEYPRTARALGIFGDIGLQLRVKQGRIISVGRVSGSPLLASWSSRWVRNNWQFLSTVTGEYFLPISYKA